MTNILAKLSEILGVPAGDIIVEARRLKELYDSPRATRYDWSRVPAEFKWAATDSDGYAWAYDSEPSVTISKWRNVGRKCVLFDKDRSDWCNWRDSLEARPK